MMNVVKKAREVQRLGYDISFAFIPPFPDSPPLPVCIGRYRDLPAIGIGFGGEPGVALAKALSEVVERLLWIESPTLTTDFIEGPAITNDSQFLNLSELAGLTEEDRSALSSIPLNDARVRWVDGRDISTSSSIRVPAQLVSNFHAFHTRETEPYLREPNSNGLACGRTFDEAVYHGLLELVERDAFMITYFNTMIPSRITPDTITHPECRAFMDTLKKYGLEYDLMILPTDMPTHVMCAVVRDTTGEGPACMVGAKAHHDWETAAFGALREALGAWTAARFTARYKKEDPTILRSSAERIGFWGKREHVEKLAWLWSGEFTDIESKEVAHDARSLARAARARGCQCAAVSLSTPMFKNMNLHAVSVISPELQPMNLRGDITYREGKRLSEIPKYFGKTAATVPPALPHPFP